MLLSIIMDRQSITWINLKKFSLKMNTSICSCEPSGNCHFILKVKRSHMSDIWFVAPRNKAC